MTGTTLPTVHYTSPKPVNERSSVHVHFIGHCTVHTFSRKKVVKNTIVIQQDTKTLQRNIGISFYMVVKLVMGDYVVNEATQSCSF